MKKKITRNIRWISAALCVVMACALLTGCMNTDNNSTQTPDAEPSERPEMSFTPQNTQSVQPQSSPTNAIPFDWLQMGLTIENRINMISEIEDSRVLVSEGTALVGITFANLYQGELTQRIHDMVAAEVQSADPTIQTVAVTAEAEDVEKIRQIAERIATGTPVSEVESEIDSIVRNMTTIQ